MTQTWLISSSTDGRLVDMHVSLLDPRDCADVTVIIPAYNAAKHIDRALESLASQRLYRPRVVVVDDGSTDGTTYKALEVTSELGMPIEIVRQRNMGVGEARNKGLTMANTEYVMFLDADDYLESECIGLLHVAAQQSNAEITFCGFDRVDHVFCNYFFPVVADSFCSIPPQGTLRVLSHQ